MCRINNRYRHNPTIFVRTGGLVAFFYRETTCAPPQKGLIPLMGRSSFVDGM
jgi:hypothetical protein